MTLLDAEQVRALLLFNPREEIAVLARSGLAFAARIEALEQALRPFATMADQVDAWQRGELPHEIAFKADDLRRARAALAQTRRADKMSERWRVGRHFPIHIYEGEDIPVATALTVAYAKQIVADHNAIVTASPPQPDALKLAAAWEEWISDSKNFGSRACFAAGWAAAITAQEKP